MKLESIKDLNLKYGDLIEYIFEDETFVRLTRPGYYLDIVENVPAVWKKDHIVPPFISIANSKDKNGAHREINEYSIEKLLYIEKRRDGI